MSQFLGRVLKIFIAPRHGEVPLAVEQAQAVAGQGLVGDRHYAHLGTPDPANELTLIEIESLEALLREYELLLRPEEARRNVLTAGVPLNHLVGREFDVGPVLLRGIKLCEPCGHLEKLTVKGIQKGLRHRGGLRAQIVRGGTLKVGDAITHASTARAAVTLEGQAKETPTQP